MNVRSVAVAVCLLGVIDTAWARPRGDFRDSGREHDDVTGFTERPGDVENWTGTPRKWTRGGTGERRGRNARAVPSFGGSAAGAQGQKPGPGLEQSGPQFGRNEAEKFTGQRPEFTGKPAVGDDQKFNPGGLMEGRFNGDETTDNPRKQFTGTWKPREFTGKPREYTGKPREYTGKDREYSGRPNEFPLGKVNNEAERFNGKESSDHPHQFTGKLAEFTGKALGFTATPFGSRERKSK